MKGTGLGWNKIVKEIREKVRKGSEGHGGETVGELQEKKEENAYSGKHHFK